MSDQYRYGDDRNDRYRQDTYRSEDPRAQDQGRNYGGRGGEDYRAERFGQAYGGGSEGRSFTDNGGYNPYANSTYGGSYGEDRNRSGYRSDNYGGQPYNDRQAAGAMMHQGYRSPFGGGASLDRNDYRSTDYRANEGDNQRYQYNDYRPTHEQAGRFARTGAAAAQYGYGMDGRGSQQERGFWDQTRDEVSSWFGDDQAARRRQMDEARAGEHSGRGPKGYTRSDDRIREDLNDRLTDDHRLDASDIDVKVDKGEVTLTGHVTQRADKRRAEDIADFIGGVKHVQNNLRVKESAASSYGDTTSTAQTTGATTSTAMGAASATRSN